MTDAAPLSAAPLTVSVPSSARDFPDWISPMLVKELRQGMRSPVFIWGLTAMHVGLAIICWLTVEAGGGEQSLSTAFWTVICTLVCGLLPLRATNALYDELHGNTVDTLVLTRLNGMRIALGKWIAIASQQVLVTITVLPYVIVRYFSGGLNTPMELAWIGIFLLVGIGAAALLTGLSWLKHFLLRSAIMLGVLGMVAAFCGMVIDDYLENQRYGLEEFYQDLGIWGFVLILVAAVHLCFFTLDIGAGRLGVLAENRSTRRRIIALLACAVYGAAIWDGDSTGSRLEEVQAIAMVLLAFTAGLTISQALSEMPANLTPVLDPFVRKGWVGRMLGRFFYPGWASGLNWSLLLLVPALVSVGFLLKKQVELGVGSTYWIYFQHSLFVGGTVAVAIFGTFPIPIVIGHLIRRIQRWHFGWYLLCAGLLAAWQVIFVMVCELSSKASMLLPGFLLPTMSFAGFSYQERDWYTPYRRMTGQFYQERALHWPDEAIAAITLVTSLAWWIIALALARSAFRQTRAAEREIQDAARQEAALAGGKS